MDVGATKGSHDSEELPMQTVTTIGLDIAKSVFQVHGVDAAGQVVIRRQLKRRYVLAFFQKLPLCLVGIEGVRLIPLLVARAPGNRPQRATDAASVCEALRQAAEERYGGRGSDL
jgi:transposase